MRTANSSTTALRIEMTIAQVRHERISRVHIRRPADLAPVPAHPRLANPVFRTEDPQAWRAACDQIASDVYAFEAWDGVYEQTFGEPFSPPSAPQGSECDGLRHDRRGEGPRHRALRLWVRDQSGAIRASYAGLRTTTEVVLDSADRVDVVYYGRA